MRNVAHYLGTRQISPAAVRSYDPTTSVATRLPFALVEHEMQGVDAYDKVFNSLWLSPSTVTKCNSLVEWDVETMHSRRIPLPVGRPAPSDSCGMHSLAVNPSKTLLAVGGSNPSDALILDLATYRPLLRLEGHSDWIFGMCFLTNNVLVTCGRDAALQLWSLHDVSPASAMDAPAVRGPTLQRRAHMMKVRELRHMVPLDKLATLSADETVKLWDTQNMDVTASYRLFDREDLVALAWDDDKHLLAVGSQNGLTFIDPRTRSPFQGPRQDRWGVRSITFRHNLLSIGGGDGTICFYDMRGCVPVTLDGRPVQITTGAGWVRKDASYFTHRHHYASEPPNVVYTHAWDASGSRLFIGGGPMLVSLTGSYCGLWA